MTVVIQNFKYFLKINYIFIFLFISQSCQSQWTIDHFTTDHGLPVNGVQNITCDENGIIWIATMGGLVTYNGITFEPFKTQGSKRIFNIFKNKDNEIFFINSDRDIYVIKDNKYAKVDKYKYLTPAIQSKFNLEPMSETRIISFIVDNGYHIKMDKNGDYKFDKPIFDQDITKVKGAMIKGEFIEITPSGFKLIKIQQKSDLYIKDVSSDFKLDYPEFYKFSKFYRYNDKIFILFKNNLLLLKCQNGKIIITTLIEQVPFNTDVTSIFASEDESVIYFGLNQNGLFKMSKNQFSTGYYSESANYFNNIYSQLETSDGAILTANGLEYLGNNFKKFIEGSYSNTLGFIYKDNNEQLWINHKGQIKRIDRTFKPKTNAYLPCDRYECDFIQINGIYYNSTSNIFRILELKNGEFKVKSEFPLSKEAVIERIVLKDIDTLELWTRRGMYYFKLSTQTISKSSLPDLYYRSIQLASNGKDRFITTYGDGWFLEKNNKLTKLPEDKNNFLNTAHNILIDDQKFLWIATNRGLFQILEDDIYDYVNRKNEHIYIHTYNKKDGFVTDEFNGGRTNSAIKLSNGKFSFSTLHGLVIFDPNAVKPFLPTSNLFISNLKIDNKKSDLPETDTIFLDSHYKSVEVGLGTTHYDNKINNIYLYWRIAGFVDQWQPVNLHEKIYIPKLNSGTYTFELKKLTGFGKENFSFKKYVIKVLPFWYETIWGALIIVILFAFFLYTMFILNTWRIKKQKIVLQNTINERNSELITINNELHNSLAQNEMLLSVMVHDIKSPIKFVHELAEGIYQDWDDIQPIEKKTMINSIIGSTQKINNFIHQFMIWTQARKAGQIMVENISIHGIIEDVISIYTSHPKIIKGKIVFRNEIPFNTNHKQNRQLLHIAMNNLVENSLKFTFEGYIAFRYIEDEDTYTLSCEDTGRGMKAHDKENILSGSYKINSLRSDSYRLGYLFIKDVVKLMNGRLSIVAFEGKGTEVSLTFQKH